MSSRSPLSPFGRHPAPSTLAPDDAVASFDSASAMLRATARALQGRDFPRLGHGHLEAAAVRVANLLPLTLRQRAYSVAGASEAFPSERLSEVDAEELAQWVVDHYPRRRYPAIAVGSSNGAGVHLYGALGAPWLPQTLLLPVRVRSDTPDDPSHEMEVAARIAEPFLAANSGLALHHMYDPNQDRLMVPRVAYFRVKWVSLPQAYRRFLEECLQAGGPVIVPANGTQWPVIRVGERHVFQFGAVGGATVDEYFHGGPRVRAFLRAHGAAVDQWPAPAPDGEAPEAEWGFASELRDDIGRWAAAAGHPVRDIEVAEPEDLSPPVAELFRRWYADRGLPTDRLLVESFVLQDPVAVLETASVPFWTVFPVEGSARRLADYLDAAAPYDEIRAMAFQHGVRSVGLAELSQWHDQFGRASRIGEFIGLDETRYPADFAVFARYDAALRRIKPRYSLPTEPLPLTVLDELGVGETR